MSESDSDFSSAEPLQNPQLGLPKDEEEGISRYKAGGFHPVRINEIFNNKYIVIRKLGWGSYSTIWLVQDFFTSAEKKYAMKVFSTECYGTDTDIFELKILQHLQHFRGGARNHPGYQYVSILHESFTHKGPNGDYVCLIFQSYVSVGGEFHSYSRLVDKFLPIHSMFQRFENTRTEQMLTPIISRGEDLSTFRDWFDERKIPTPLVQKFTKQLLQALEYAHERGVIHTDIHPSNIMIEVPDEIELNYNFLDATSPDIISSDRENIYFEEGFNLMNLNIALSDWGVASFVSRHLTEEIQPLLLRAPEVLLNAPWDTKVDIWNLGALIPELVFGQKMFCGKDKKGEYRVGIHLEEMVGLCGPFPRSLLGKGDQRVVNDVFDEDGNLKVKELEKVVGLEKRFEGMDVKERSKFVAFIKRMLVLDSEE